MAPQEFVRYFSECQIVNYTLIAAYRTKILDLFKPADCSVVFYWYLPVIRISSLPVKGDSSGPPLFQSGAIIIWRLMMEIHGQTI